jgi:hypothetical protein
MQDKKSSKESYAFVGKSKLETSLGNINTDNTRPCFAVKTEKLIFHSTDGIKGTVQSTNGPGIARGQAILDMMQCSVDEKLRVGSAGRTDVPGSRFDTDIVTD